MTDPQVPEIPDLEAWRAEIARFVQNHWKWFLFQGLLMVVLGGLSIAMPIAATIAAEIITGWLFLVAGAGRLAWSIKARALPGFLLSLLSSLLTIAVGVVLLAFPARGVLTLTMVLIAFFLVQGIATIAVAFSQREHLPSWGWTALSGAVDLVLAYLIWSGWPSTAAWAMGMLVGINLVFFGLPLVMTALAARNSQSGSGPGAAA